MLYVHPLLCTARVREWKRFALWTIRKFAAAGLPFREQGASDVHIITRIVQKSIQKCLLYYDSARFQIKVGLYFFSPRLNHYGNRNRLNQYSGWSPLCADPVGKLEDDLLCRQTIRTVVKLFALRHRLEGVLDIKWRYVKNYGCCTCQCICSSSILGQVIPISSVTLIGYSN